jgi:hypothetical protein
VPPTQRLRSFRTASRAEREFQASQNISPPLTLPAMTSGSAVQTAPSIDRGIAQTPGNFGSFVRALLTVRNKISSAC